MQHDPDTLKHIMDYCDKKWAEDDRPLRSELMQAMHPGKKAAYADVIQYARKLLIGRA